MRPYRNPVTNGNVIHNQRYISHQITLPEAEREGDIGFLADSNLLDWAGWRADQPDLWYGGFEGLPRQWGGLSDEYTDDELAVYRRPDRNVVLGGNVGLGLAPGGRARREARDEQPDNVGLFKKYKPLNLEKLSPGEAVIRDVSLPPFKIDYDSHEQINTKLTGTVIMIKDNPFYILRTAAMGDGTYGLIVQDRVGTYSVMYDDVKDCRPIAPGYVSKDGAVYWLYRIPERQNQQGMNHRNMHFRNILGDQSTGARWEWLLEVLADRKDVPFSADFAQLIERGIITGLRLSNNVALYRSGKKGAPIGVEYCGRPLGLLVNGGVKVLDETDLRPSWIHKDLHKVNLTLGE